MISRRLFGGLAAGGLIGLRSAAAATSSLSLRTELSGLSRLIGKWSGEGDGVPGHSTVERTYEPTLGGSFLMVHHQSIYAPQPKNPKGETHNDTGFISFDKARKVAVFRQFHVEGFVNQYVAAADLGGSTVTFESEALENIPKGFKARETYKFTGANTFEEIFEIVEPEKEFTVYSHNRFARA